MREDMSDYKMKNESSVMQRHCVEKHDKEQEFKFKVRQVFWEDTTLRQVTEAIDSRREGNINN